MSDVFNNPSNDYVNPALSPCAGSGNDNYLEFIDGAINVVSGSNILSAIDFSDIKISVNGYSHETKTLSEGEVIYIPGLTKGLTKRQQGFIMPNTIGDSDYNPFFMQIDLSINYYNNFTYTEDSIDVSSNYNQNISIEDAINLELGNKGIKATVTYDPSTLLFKGTTYGYSFDITNVVLTLIPSADPSVFNYNWEFNLEEDISKDISYAKYPNGAMQGIIMKGIYPSSTAQGPYDNWLYINNVTDYVYIYKEVDINTDLSTYLNIGFDTSTSIGITDPNISYSFSVLDTSDNRDVSANYTISIDNSIFTKLAIEDVSINNSIGTDSSFNNVIILDSSIITSYIKDSSIIGLFGNDNILSNSLIEDASLSYTQFFDSSLSSIWVEDSYLIRTPILRSYIFDSSINKSIITDCSIYGINTYIVDSSIYDSNLSESNLDTIKSENTKFDYCLFNNVDINESTIIDSNITNSLIINDTSIQGGFIENSWINAVRVEIGYGLGYDYSMDEVLDSSSNTVYITNTDIWDSSINNAIITDCSIFRSVLKDTSLNGCTIYNTPMDSHHYQSNLDNNRIILIDPSIQNYVELVSDGSTYYTKTRKILDVGMSGSSTPTKISAGDYLEWITTNNYWNKFGQIYIWTTAPDCAECGESINLIDGFYVFNPHTFDIKIEYLLFI